MELSQYFWYFASSEVTRIAQNLAPSGKSLAIRMGELFFLEAPPPNLLGIFFKGMGKVFQVVSLLALVSCIACGTMVILAETEGRLCGDATYAEG